MVFNMFSIIEVDQLFLGTFDYWVALYDVFFVYGNLWIDIVLGSCVWVYVDDTIYHLPFGTDWSVSFSIVESIFLSSFSVAIFSFIDGLTLFDRLSFPLKRDTLSFVAIFTLFDGLTNSYIVRYSDIVNKLIKLIK